MKSTTLTLENPVANKSLVPFANNFANKQFMGLKKRGFPRLFFRH